MNLQNLIINLKNIIITVKSINTNLKPKEPKNKKASCNSGLNQWLLSGKYAMAQLFNLMFCLYLYWLGVRSTPLI